jgi:hypothetical protein
MVSGIQGTSSISSDMIAQMKEKMFARLDSDGDGQIDLATLAEEMQAHAAEADSETSAVSDRPDPFADLYEALTAADTNGDGVVSADEFDAMELPPPPPGPPPEEASSDFSTSLYSESAADATQYNLVGTLLDQLG